MREDKSQLNKNKQKLINSLVYWFKMVQAQKFLHKYVF